MRSNLTKFNPISKLNPTDFFVPPVEFGRAETALIPHDVWVDLETSAPLIPASTHNHSTHIIHTDTTYTLTQKHTHRQTDAYARSPDLTFATTSYSVQKARWGEDSR